MGYEGEVVEHRVCKHEIRKINWNGTCFPNILTICTIRQLFLKKIFIKLDHSSKFSWIYFEIHSMYATFSGLGEALQLKICPG